MCGRYVATRSAEELGPLFGVTDPPSGAAPLEPSWNVAPTDRVWAVFERADRHTGQVQRRLRAVRWGLVPSWAKNPDSGARMINARVESVHERPAYRRAFAKRRCLLPADGFYEWRSVPAAADRKAYKQPYYIAPEDGTVMALAGLYEFWRDPQVPDGEPDAWLTSCTVITTEATDAAGRIHPRMPLAVHAEDYDAWLAPDRESPDDLRALLRSPADGHLSALAVRPDVNSVRNDGPHLLDPA